MGRSFSFTRNKPPSGVPADANTVMMVRFDEVSGNATVEGKGYPWIFAPSSPQPSGVPGKISNARQFNNTAHYLEMGVIGGGGGNRPDLIATLSGECTWEFWVNPSPSMTDGAVIAFTEFNQYSGWTVILVNAARGITWAWDTALYTGSWMASNNGVLTNNVWNHCALRKRSAGGGLYYRDFFVNGVLDSTSASAANVNPGTTTEGIRIGRRYTNPVDWQFIGLIDDMRLSNVARTPTEILTTYQLGTG